MSDVDLWMDSDSPEPERIQSLPDTWDELRSATPEETEAAARHFFEKLDAMRARRGAPKGAAVAAVFPLAWVAGPRQADEEGVTVRCPTFDPRAVAAPPPEPFVASPPPAEPLVPSPPVNAGKAAPPQRHPLEHLKITMPALPISAEARCPLGGLPFKPPTPGNELARTKQVPVYNPRHGQTMPLGDDSIEKPVTVLPFVGAAIGAGVVSFPRLSLEQYASLCAELALWPTRSREILSRYHVMNEAAHRALSEHWQAELAVSSEAHAMFVKAITNYAAWLRAQRA